MDFKWYLLKHLFLCTQIKQLPSANFSWKNMFCYHLCIQHTLQCTCIYTGFFHCEKTTVKKCVVSWTCHTRNSAYNSTTPMFTIGYQEHGMMEWSTIHKDTSTAARRRKQERSSSAHRVISWIQGRNQDYQCGRGKCTWGKWLIICDRIWENRPYGKFCANWVISTIRMRILLHIDWYN